MSGIFQPIIALILVVTAKPRGGEEVLEALGLTRSPDVLGSLAALLGYLLLVAVTTRLPVRRYVRAGRTGTFRPLPGLDLLHLAAFAGLVLGTDWVLVIERKVTSWPVISTLLEFLPFAAATAVKTAISYDALPERRRGPGKRRGLVVFSLRVLALPVVPILLILGLREVVLLDPELAVLVESFPPVTALLVVVTAGLVFSLAPLLVRWILLARPVPEGPLRSRLLDYCDRVGFRINDVLVWRTGRTVTNALFIGILPFLRYVVLTDELMERLDEDEVEAVFAHETGHGARRHTQLFLLFAFGFMLLNVSWTGPVLDVLSSVAGGWAQDLALTVMVGFSLGLIFVFFGAFGWMSRRFETEADIYAMQTLNRPQAFPQALEKVGLHMGAVGRRGGLRHFGIGTRIGLLDRYRYEPEFREHFDRVLRRCRLGIIALCLVGVAPLVVQGTGPLDAARARFLAQEVDTALKEGRYEEAEKLLGRMEDYLPDAGRVARFNHRNLGFILEAVRGEADPGKGRGVIEELVTRLSPLQPRVAEGPVYSDLYLAVRAEDPGYRPRRSIEGWSPAARLIWRLDGLSQEDPPPPGILEEAEAAAKEPRFRLDLFKEATGGLAPLEAVLKRFPDLAPGR